MDINPSATTLFEFNGQQYSLEILHKLAHMSGYEEQVPTIEQFIDDPFYLGKVLGDGLYPIWRDAAKKTFPNPYHSPYNELVLTGGIGLGKSTFALLVTMYNICRMLSLKSPHKYYNLLDSTIIAFAMMNATKSLAGQVLWSQFTDWVEASPYFRSKVAPKGSKTFFIKNIDVSIGSRGRDYLGQATAHAIFSEINDMTVVGGQAIDSLDTISTRRESRFGGKGKEILGHLILDSSNKGNRSFIDARLEEKDKKLAPGAQRDYVVFRFSHWEAKWHLGGYSGEMFQVFAGDENTDPFIIDDTNRHRLDRLPANRVIDVPVEHKEAFEFNIIKSLRDLAGVSTFSSFSFISSAVAIKEAFCRPNAVSKDLIELDFFNREQKLIDLFDVNLMKFMSDRPRFIHIDLGLKTDSTGISATYLDSYNEVTRYDPVKGEKVLAREPHFVTEWSLEVRAVPGHEVPIYKIKELILELRSRGYPIAVVSTDGFQSSNLRQDLTLEGISCELISVDRTKDPYNELRNAILEKRIKAPNISKLVKEVRELEEHEDKFDHPAGGGGNHEAGGEIGTKDILDSVCGSMYSALKMQRAGKPIISTGDVNKLLDAAIKSRTSLESVLLGR